METPRGVPCGAPAAAPVASPVASPVRYGTGMPRFETRLTRTFRAPRELVWALVADTQRLNRAAGNRPARYQWRDRDGGRRLVATARELGQALEWTEPPYQWLEGELMESERRFSLGPARRAFSGARVRAVDADHTACELWMGFEGPGARLASLGWLVRARHRVALRRTLDALDAALASGRPPDDCVQPATVRARRLLTATTTAAALVGPSSPTDEAALAERLSRLAAVEPDAALRDRLATLLRSRPDEELALLRPFELAAQWGAPRRDVLRLFLRATRAGALDLRWQVNCPTCRVGAQTADHLEQLGRTVHCEACNVDYGIDFGDFVEAVFRVNPAVRATATATYCASSPAWRPHVFAQLTVEPGTPRRETATLPPGELKLRALGARRAAALVLDDPPATLTVRCDADGVTAEATGRAADGVTALTLHAEAGAPATVVIERAGWSADAALGRVVATFPEFLDLFATEAPATGVELTVGHLAILFSDLTGSTALYERLGDARAFALVEEHFVELARVIGRHDGAVVKTMGDAVMATFPGAAAALRAATEMARAHAARHAASGLQLKLGVHAGPCLAVRANDRLDFFGATVNVAARLQAQAQGGELVVLRELADAPSAAPLLDGLPRRAFAAQLKGIAAAQELVAVRCADDAAPP